MPLDRENYQFLANLIFEDSGIEIGEKKEYYLESKLRPLLKSLKFNAYSDLVHFFRSSPEDPLEKKILRKKIIEAITIHETFFFREKIIFDFLQFNLIPRLFALRPSLHLWSAGCSTGQEAYSLAMICKEVMRSKSFNCKIWASDLSSSAIAKAKKGIYSSYEVLRGNDSLKTESYLRPHENSWMISPEIKEMIFFEELNLVKAIPYLQQFDIVFCRNVLIYFTTEVKRAVLKKIANSVIPGGYVILGSAENHAELDEIFVKIHPEFPIYQVI